MLPDSSGSGQALSFRKSSRSLAGASGFEPFNADDAANLDLYLLTKDIAETLASL
jgi:hypothetical protein